MRRAYLALVAAGCAVLTGACTSASGSAPTFLPSPGGGFPSEGPGVQISPIVPGPPDSGGSGGSTSGGATGSGSGSPATPSQSPTGKTDPLVVATRLTAPVGLAVLPDETALVGERTTGRIVLVQPVAGKPVKTVKTLTGLDTAGDGGLLDLAVSPEYQQDNLVYAYITTATDNRIVDFTLGGPVTPVLTGIPRGTNGNGARMQFGADGTLYVNTGNAGNASLAASPKSLAGKILRINGIGQPASGNPTKGSTVFSSAAPGLAGLCLGTTASAPVLGVGSANSSGNVDIMPRDGTPTTIATLPSTTVLPGDCAITDTQIWVASLDGRAALAATLTPSTTGGSAVTIGKFSATFVGKYGRLRTMVAAPDGSLWATTSNRDGHGKPVAADERVIHFMPSSSSSNNDLR